MTASPRTVPIVGFSTLMLAPELIRIQEKPLANWVTPAKVNAIRGEFMRQCDTLDGLADGIINNYMACRAIFDVTQGKNGTTSVGRQTVPQQRRSESGRHHRQRVPDRRADRDAGVHLLTLRVRHAARARHEDIRHVGAEYRSVRERPHREHAIQRTGRRARDRCRPLAPWRAGRHRLPDEEPRGESARLRRRRAAERAARRESRACSIRPIPTSAPSRSAAAR